MIRDNRGFTIAEVLVAIVILSVGLLAIAGSTGSVMRMLARGRRATNVAVIAANRMDWLRREANKTDPRCTTLASGTLSRPGNVTERWAVAGTGSSRTVSVVVNYPTSQGMTSDTVRAFLECL
jgi:prepilin-type N-terminal cleavage/methylation domain-containing protein